MSKRFGAGRWRPKIVSQTRRRYEACSAIYCTISTENALRPTCKVQQPVAFALVGDMALEARYAYAGQTDPVTGNSQGGALWIYNNVQRLATFDVMPYSAK